MVLQGVEPQLPLDLIRPSSLALRSPSHEETVRRHPDWKSRPFRWYNSRLKGDLRIRRVSLDQNIPVGGSSRAWTGQSAVGSAARGTDRDPELQDVGLSKHLSEVHQYSWALRTSHLTLHGERAHLHGSLMIRVMTASS